MEELLAIHPTSASCGTRPGSPTPASCPPAATHGDGGGAGPGREARSPSYREAYAAFRADLGPSGLDGLSDEEVLERRLLPIPDKATVRVFATQSTHKSLSAVPAGLDASRPRRSCSSAEVAEPFTEAFLTHTSTSPNHQLVASLDVARKQVELEGSRWSRAPTSYALRMRDRVASDPQISRYLSILEPEQLVPAARALGFSRYAEARELGGLERAFADDEFVLDPTRLTLYTALTGQSGFEFRSQVLMRTAAWRSTTRRSTPCS